MHPKIRKLVQAETMACWWPSKYTGRTKPDWVGIGGELTALIRGAEAREDAAETARLQRLLNDVAAEF